jgi:hypothetical protein
MPTRKEPVRGLDTHVMLCIKLGAQGRGVFANVGASPLALSRNRIRKLIDSDRALSLEKSDIAVFLLGEDITAPVLREVDLAIALNKRTLLILRDVSRRSQALQDAIKKLDVKYATYSGLENFSGVLRNAIDTEIVSALGTAPQRAALIPSIACSRVPWRNQP